MERNNYSERLLEVRKAKNINKLELSRILGVSSGYISEIEQGKKMPGLSFLVSLQRELHVSIDWFLSGNGHPFIGQIYETKDNIVVDIINTLEKLSNRTKEQVLDQLKEKRLLADLMEERNKDHIG